MSFNDWRSQQFYAATLGPMAEPVTFTDDTCPAGRPITMRIENHQSEADSREINRDTERVLAICGRDESNPKSGIADRPRSPCKIQRQGDSDSRVFAFTGEIVRETPYSWHLIFERARAKRVGTSGRGQ